MFFLDGFWSEVGGAIVDALRSLMLSLCEIIYKLIVFFFDIFMMLGSAEILENETIQATYERIGLIIGLFMIFRVIFALIQYITNPDMMNDKQKGLFNIIKKIIIVVVLLGTTPSIFKLAYQAQDLIVESNVIPKLVIGKNIDVGDSGATLAWHAFNSFYVFDENVISKDECPYLSNGVIENHFKETYSLKYAYNCLNKRFTYTDSITKEETEYYLIDFVGHGFVAVVVGLVILWMVIMYVIQVGVRVIQLAYLQLVAPAPIIMYLTPKGDDTLNKWVKQCVSTYIDFFIRIAIIYFIIYIINLLIMNDTKDYFINSLGNATDTELSFVTIVMILALLIFAQKLPKLLKEVFPSLGSGGGASFDFGLNPKKEVFEPLKQLYNTTPLGWAPKAVGGLAKNAITAYDRKKYNLPKPRNKVQQYFDKLAPGHADAIKNKNEIADRQRLKDEGRAIYTSNGGTLTANDFTSKDYQKSWQAVKNAKDALKTADQDLDYWRNEVAQGRIDTTDSNYQSALKNQKAATAKLEAAKRDHDNNRKIYVKDARKEDAFGYFKDLEGASVDKQKADAARRKEVKEEVQRRVEEQESAETTQQYFDEQYGIDYDATDHGAPTESFSAIADKYRDDNEETAAEDAAQQHFNELNNVDYNASEHGAPTEAFSAIAEKYAEEDRKTQEEAQRRLAEEAERQRQIENAQNAYNMRTGVVSEDGNGPKVTAENSIFVQLDKEAKQEQEIKIQQDEVEKQRKMQEEFKNRNMNE